MKGLLFTYTLTALGTVGGLLNPFYGLLVYICFAIVRPEFMWFWSVTPGNYSRVVALATLLGWGLQSLGSWTFGRASAVVALLMLYWGWMTVSAAGSLDQSKAWELVEFHAKVFLPFLVGATTIRSVQQIKQLAWVILLSMGYVAFELNLYYLGGNNMAREGFGGMDNNCLAIAMVTGLGLAYFLGMSVKEWWLKIGALGAAAAMGHVILLTFSRGGMLALALTALMGFFLIPKRPAHYFAFAVAIALGIRLSGTEVRERFMTAFSQSDSGLREASAQSRIELWRGALDVARRYPIFGVGPDCWGEIAPEYGWKRGKEAHSLWVQNAAELGIPGVLMLGLFYLVIMVRLWPLAREDSTVSDPWIRDASRMVIASLFGFVIAAQFVTIKHLEIPYYVALVGVGVLSLPVPEAPRGPPVWFSPSFRRPRPHSMSAV